jgi:hypothetical protein
LKQVRKEEGIGGRRWGAKREKLFGGESKKR